MFADLSAGQLASNALLMSALGISSCAMTGALWAGPTVIVCALVFTAPNIIPLDANMLFREEGSAQTFAIAAVLASAGIAGYIRYGSRGLINTARRRGIP